MHFNLESFIKKERYPLTTELEISGHGPGKDSGSYWRGIQGGRRPPAHETEIGREGNNGGERETCDQKYLEKILPLHLLS